MRLPCFSPDAEMDRPSVMFLSKVDSLKQVIK